MLPFDIDFVACPAGFAVHGLAALNRRSRAVLNPRIR